MSLVGRDLCVGDGLDPFEQGGCLSHRGDQVCTYTGSDALALRIIRESVQVCHSNGHVSTRRLVDWLISAHVETITEVVRRKLSFLICAPPSAIGIALFVELLLLVCFSVDNRFIGSDIENKISPPRWKD